MFSLIEVPLFSPSITNIVRVDFYLFICEFFSIEKASDEDVRDLYQELDIMVNIGHHKNLVNVIGACEEPGKRKDRGRF